MGITPLFADLLIREHKYKPLPETVHLMGRQTVHFSYELALRMLDVHGVEPKSIDPELDTSTIGAQRGTSDFITDETFFKLLGVQQVRAIDVSDYEGADIIADLNEPVDGDYAGVCDFIFGGSVLDNIFSPSEYIRNIARLLAPGGRLFEQNVFMMKHHPYIIAPPSWYFDFFILNNFDDVKIYVVENSNIYFASQGLDQSFFSDFGDAKGADIGVMVLAEKGVESTAERIPNQDQYRLPDEWELFRRNQKRIGDCRRPIFHFSEPAPVDLAATPLRNACGYEFVGTFRPYSPAEFEKIDAESVRDPGGIRVVEASYGLNALHTRLPKPGIMPVCRGNVTSQMALLCNGRSEIDWEISVSHLGDPAPEVSKDFTLLFYYAQDPQRRLQEINVTAEAHGQRLRIPPFDAE